MIRLRRNIAADRRAGPHRRWHRVRRRRRRNREDVRSLSSVGLSSRLENIGTMTRINLWWSILPLLLSTFGASGAPRVERGNLIFDNIPDAPAELTDALDGYLSARQATPLCWSPKGQTVISTRFGDVQQLHVVD